MKYLKDALKMVLYIIIGTIFIFIGKEILKFQGIYEYVGFIITIIGIIFCTIKPLKIMFRNELEKEEKRCV